ncbi:HET-domain-containing protein [Aulographum hederae CBS 113979]|uniref:HET-domain-containing protein n=1 Tax=Aulographum hederae CBS 113979 TaxID=1176131 RepID=A0A6G1GJZ1_9PEZI|nr:HET-domain-containing protein [Aulographum hederae CBS 113979]
MSLCTTCHLLLRGHYGSEWRGTFDLRFRHHATRQDLQNSARLGCGICQIVFREVSRIDARDSKGRLVRELRGQIRRVASGKWESDPQEPLLRVGISRVPDISGIYSMEFRTTQSERVGTFVLNPVDNSTRRLRTTYATSTDSDEVFQLARDWLKQCTKFHHNCRVAHNTWYPRRLINIGTAFVHKSPDKKVYLVLTDPENKEGNNPSITGPYLTLSHCWGKSKPLRLHRGNVTEFTRGILIDQLPKTFRDAMQFTARLGIRYIWIDSLCIVQDDEIDWLHQSAQMDRVYSNSYCNLSATCATDSDQGLFTTREPYELWETDANLNTEGIPGRLMSLKDVVSRVKGVSDPVERCSVLDISFWERMVDKAPVNLRAWVLQERLLAPRILHFCQGQIAWECAELDAAESFPDGLTNFQLSAGAIVDGGRLKSLVPEIDGKRLRETRLKLPKGKPDPQPHLIPDIYTYELWKHVVEAYSTTALTKPGDKLIALSGIAKVMAGMLSARYVVGMWNTEHLASQLLWRVNEKYERGAFSYLSERPKEYRAPSFSWVAVDAETGITYGEVLDQENLLMEVTEVHVELKSRDDFGLVKSGFLDLTGRLRRIEMVELDQVTRYGWRLAKPSLPGSQRLFTNVYLDAPRSDTDIFEPGANLYCMPAAWSQRKNSSSKDLICLLLQQLDGNNYKRIGLAKVSAYDRGQNDVLSLIGDEPMLPPRPVTRTVRII